MEFFDGMQVGKLAPQIGDYDFEFVDDMCKSIVGKLAPQIGDYDPE